MKKICIYFSVFFLSLLLLTCDFFQKDIISFTVNGKAVEVMSGNVDSGGVPFFAESAGIYIIAGSKNTWSDNIYSASDSIVLTNFVYSPPTKQVAELNVTFTHIATYYMNDIQTLSSYEGPVQVVLESDGDIGKYCRGTFQGEFVYNDMSYSIENGFFNVKRIDAGTAQNIINYFISLPVK